jgi:hypothetical protein
MLEDTLSYKLNLSGLLRAQSAIVDQSFEAWGLSTLPRGKMYYLTSLRGSPAISCTTNIHPSILWHFVKYNLFHIRYDYPLEFSLALAEAEFFITKINTNT